MKVSFALWVWFPLDSDYEREKEREAVGETRDALCTLAMPIYRGDWVRESTAGSS